MADDRPRRRELRLTERDTRVLRFVADHRIVLETQVQALVGAKLEATRARLRSLAANGFLAYARVFDGEPAHCQIRRPGLAAIGSPLPPPRLNLAEYQHDVGVAWLWLAAHAGRFGPLGRVVAERELRSADRRADREGPPSGVRLGGFGPRGIERLHYPDLLLVTAHGERIAIELELTAKGRARREKILAGYGADSRVDGVLYLVDKPQLRRTLEDSARRLGISALIHVRRFEWGRHERAPARGLQLSRARAAGLEACA